MKRVTYNNIKLSIVRERAPEPYELGRKLIESGDDVASLARSIIGRQTREHFLAIYLDARHRVQGVHLVSIGSVSTAQVHPREVFTPAVHLTSSALIVAHNHPSGDATPSPEDREVTERLRDAGELLGIELLDHVVMGSDRYYSFAEGRYQRNP